jgi:hypothetical protein
VGKRGRRSERLHLDGKEGRKGSPTLAEPAQVTRQQATQQGSGCGAREHATRGGTRPRRACSGGGLQMMARGLEIWWTGGGGPDTEGWRRGSTCSTRERGTTRRAAENSCVSCGSNTKISKFRIKTSKSIVPKLWRS